MSFTNWNELARRWQDRCITCGSSDQRLISFSQCIHCRVEELKREKNKKQKNKDS